jgi:hypothetical protein
VDASGQTRATTLHLQVDGHCRLATRLAFCIAKRHSRELRQQAYLDPVTGQHLFLLNRRLSGTTLQRHGAGGNFS